MAELVGARAGHPRRPRPWPGTTPSSSASPSPGCPCNSAGASWCSGSPPRRCCASCSRPSRCSCSQIIGLLLAGGLLLLWVCWKLWRELRSGRLIDMSGRHAPREVPAEARLGGRRGRAPKTMRQAVTQIIVADVSMSLDNVLAVAGVAREHAWVLIFGLALSVAFMGLAAAVIARLLGRFHWIAYVGLAIILLCRAAHDLRGRARARRGRGLSYAVRGATTYLPVNVTARLSSLSIAQIESKLARPVDLNCFRPLRSGSASGVQRQTRSPVDRFPVVNVAVRDDDDTRQILLAQRQPGGAPTCQHASREQATGERRAV